MQYRNIELEIQDLRLGRGLVRGVSCLAIQIAFDLGASVFGISRFGLVALFVYLPCGAYLDVAVLRGLTEWHRRYNRIYRSGISRLGFCLFWPFFYPVLFLFLDAEQEP